MLYPRVNVDYSVVDFFLSVKALFKKEINLQEENSYLVNHARTGIRMALTALNLPANSTVGMVTYNCYTVMNAIKVAGHNVKFLDITDNLTLDFNDLEEKKDTLDAIIVTHLFGIPNDIVKIKEICPNIPIIEDCAHAFGSQSADYKVGELGDMAVYSVGLGKFPAIGDGGILKVNNSKYLDGVKKEYDQLETQSLSSEIKWIIKNTIYSIMHKRVFYNWVTLQAKKRQKKSDKLFVLYEHTEGKGYKTTKAIFQKRKKQIAKKIKKQQENTKTVLEWLKPFDVTVPYLNLEKNNCFMLPILVKNKEEITHFFHQKKLEVAPHFSKSIDWAKLFGYQSGECKNAEKVTERIIICPVYYKLNLKK